tara:strand:+ start:4012 stop:4533 length:522 start_codon:yes stop_codon:yes gene_type:complete
VIIQKYKLKYNIDKLNQELEERWPQSEFINSCSVGSSLTIPNGSYFQNITEGKMPNHIKKAIELSIGKNIKDYYFIWDWRTTTDLMKKHTDKKNAGKPNEFGSNIPPTVAVVSLENGFTLDIWNNENNNIIEQSVSYGPGELIVFNNQDSWHSGTVHDTSMPRRTLNCFVETN